MDNSFASVLKIHFMQLIFGLPILFFAIASILLDSMGIINVEKFGYAFFGSIIVYMMQFFFRKKVKNEEK